MGFGGGLLRVGFGWFGDCEDVSFWALAAGGYDIASWDVISGVYAFRWGAFYGLDWLGFTVVGFVVDFGLVLLREFAVAWFAGVFLVIFMWVLVMMFAFCVLFWCGHSFCGLLLRWPVCFAVWMFGMVGCLASGLVLVG